MGGTSSSVDQFGEYKEVLEKNYRSYEELPVLDLGERQGRTDYIDFISRHEMTYPIMRFRDIHGRQGFALHLRCKWGEHKDKETVLAIFQRYTDPNSIWTYGWGNNNNFLENVYFTYHQSDHTNGAMVCDNCPMHGSRITIEHLTKLLTNTDEVSSIVF